MANIGQRCEDSGNGRDRSGAPGRQSRLTARLRSVPGAKLAPDRRQEVLYGNYHNKGSGVRGKFVPSKSSNPDLLSYAAQDGAHLTVVLVNKNPSPRLTTTLEVPVSATAYRGYTLAQTLGLRLHETRGKVESKRVTVTLAPYSAMLVTTD